MNSKYRKCFEAPTYPFRGCRCLACRKFFKNRDLSFDLPRKMTPNGLVTLSAYAKGKRLARIKGRQYNFNGVIFTTRDMKPHPSRTEIFDWIKENWKAREDAWPV